jgi:hypothetical protein
MSTIPESGPLLCKEYPNTLSLAPIHLRLADPHARIPVIREQVGQRDRREAARYQQSMRVTPFEGSWRDGEHSRGLQAESAAVGAIATLRLCWYPKSCYRTGN